MFSKSWGHSWTVAFQLLCAKQTSEGYFCSTLHIRSPMYTYMYTHEFVQHRICQAGRPVAGPLRPLECFFLMREDTPRWLGCVELASQISSRVNSSCPDGFRFDVTMPQLFP
ncbi:hypothetical protein F5Y18DRAFT_385456 [Xylariaceae sp. FL1019]|nr:hypothetical protein F5Y18DRAFT_385456 [Xylariaceae sp. FL1019]